MHRTSQAVLAGVTGALLAFGAQPAATAAPQPDQYDVTLPNWIGTGRLEVHAKGTDFLIACDGKRDGHRVTVHLWWNGQHRWVAQVNDTPSGKPCGRNGGARWLGLDIARGTWVKLRTCLGGGANGGEHHCKEREGRLD